MTYWSRIWRISCGVGSLLRSARAASVLLPSSRMMSLQSSMHSSQMNTDGAAMSLRTSCWPLPQNEQESSCSPEELLSDMGLYVRPGHENRAHYPELYRVWRPQEKVHLRAPAV